MSYLVAAIEIVAVVGAVGSSVMGAVAAHDAGQAQKADAAMRSRQAALEAGQKAISIRQNLLRALATQNAAAGAGGVGTGGSIGADVNRQITQNKDDLLGLNADTSAVQAQYAAQGENAAKIGNLKAGASLLDAAGSLAKVGVGASDDGG